MSRGSVKQTPQSVKSQPAENAAKPLDFHVENMGGIERTDVRLFAGVNEFEGPNGAGKTSIIESLGALHGLPSTIEVLDGAEEGRVSGNGLSLTIRKVRSASGRAEVEIQGGDDLAELIDGGRYADEKARAKARVRALLRIQRLPVTAEAIEILAVDPAVAERALTEIRDNLIDDMLDAAEKVRRVGHAEAKASEDRAAELAATANVRLDQARDALAAIGGEAALVDVAPGEAEANAQRLRDQLAVGVSDCRRRQDLEAQQAEIRETLGERPDVAGYDAKRATIVADLAAIESEVEALTAEAQRIAERLSGVRVALAEKKALRDRIDAKIRETHDAAAEWDRRSGLLGRAVEGPLPAEVEEIERSANAAGLTAKRALGSAEYRNARAAAMEAQRSADDAATRAEFLRSVATTVQDRLGKLLNGTDSDGLTIDSNGRLCVVEGGKLFDFEKRRSEGQQIVAALRFVAKRNPSKLVPLSGAFWQALQPKAQREFAELARELGLYVVTERASDREGIAVNHLPAEAAPALAEAVNA